MAGPILTAAAAADLLEQWPEPQKVSVAGSNYNSARNSTGE